MSSSLVGARAAHKRPRTSFNGVSPSRTMSRWKAAEKPIPHNLCQQSTGEGKWNTTGAPASKMQMSDTVGHVGIGVDGLDSVKSKHDLQVMALVPASGRSQSMPDKYSQLLMISLF